MLSDGQFRKYRLRLLEREISKDEERVFCPFPDCLGVVKGRKESRIPVECELCAHTICFPCRSLSHEGVSCQENISQLFYHASMQDGMGYCPQCIAPVHKDEGCPMMSCTRCGHAWCWVCGNPSSSFWHHLSSGLCSKLNYEKANMRNRGAIFCRMLPYPTFFPVMFALAAVFFILAVPLVVVAEGFNRSFRNCFSYETRQTCWYKLLVVLTHVPMWAFLQILVAAIVVFAFTILVIPFWLAAWIALFRVLYYWRSATARERVYDADMMRAEAVVASHNRAED